MSPTASTWAGPMCHWPSTPAIARISLASVRSTGNRCGGGCAGGGAFASGSGGSRLICSFRRAGEMLPAPRGRAGAKFLKLTFAVRTMAGEPTVSLPELRSLLASGRARLFDVRSREEAAAGTIPGALNIPVSELESALQMEPAAFKALYSAEKPKLEENLIFFCQMGKRGLQATQLAQSLGYKGARNYEGAYREWLQKEG
ncbi:thiosulfate:glutathione sulfurtransferase isoform X2 [Odocoileus virginianus]|uniref:Thiosulfate:glutathione sulfurtransferase isoform X2 n=4 Tax=Odocoileinae TaxID=9881 RepID=A0A6J0X4Z9_ODOVR